MRTLTRAVVVTAAAALLSACDGSAPGGGATSPAPGRALVTVTADLFSGRENPSWHLTDAQSSAVVTCAGGPSRSVPSATDDRGVLGFRSFLLTDLPPALPYVSMRVTTSFVEGTRREGGDVLIDNCRDLYALLRSSAQSHLDPSQLSAVPTG